MTDYKKAFIDTAPFIYFIEKNENNSQYYDKVKKSQRNADGYNKGGMTYDNIKTECINGTREDTGR